MKMLVTVSLVALLTGVAAGAAPEALIGLDGNVTAVLPPRTHVAPQDSRTDVLVQIVSARAVQGGDQTMLRFWPMTAGDHDLVKNLLTADDKPLTGVPPLIVRGISSLAANWQGELVPMSLSPMSKYGGYRTFTIAAATIWMLSLIPILLLGRRRWVPVLIDTVTPDRLPPETSLADLVAAQDHLSPLDRHRLEMMLVQQWQTAHGLADQPMEIALRHLRNTPQTAVSLELLQTWLHAPADRSAAVDARRLLSPYAEKRQP